MAGMDQLDSYVVPLVQTAENCGVSAVAVHHGRRHFLRGAEAVSHGPCDHRDSPVARGYDGRCPCAGRADFPCRGTDADSHGLADHGDSAVARGQGVRRPCLQVVRVPQVLLWSRQSCSHSCTCLETRFLELFIAVKS